LKEKKLAYLKLVRRDLNKRIRLEMAVIRRTRNIQDGKCSFLRLLKFNRQKIKIETKSWFTAFSGAGNFS